MWYNKYVGIDYKDNGRDIDGIDCWGLVRLIYKNEYNITVPSFDNQYQGASDRESTSELVAITKENWIAKSTPEEGDVVLFRILGTESHVGVCISKDKFIHAKEGHASVIEDLTSAKWQNRIVGYFKYTSDIVVNAIPHPFKTEKYTETVKQGTTILELVDNINSKHGISDKLKSNISVMVNGIPVNKDAWSRTVIQTHDKIEYRAIPRGDNPLRMILMVAVMFAAPQLAGAIPGITAGTTLFTATTIAIQMVGMALADAIAPVRMPEVNNPGSPDSLNMFSGGSNPVNAYGTIPVILGRVRITPPLGAQTILESPEDSSYLKMITVWGFGPLFLEDASLQIGGTALSEFKNRNGSIPEYYHLDFSNISATPSAAEISRFNSIYGFDTVQVPPNIELVLENNATTNTNEAVLYKGGRIAVTGIQYTGNAVANNLRLIVDSSSGSFYLRDEGWNTDIATFTITATQNNQTASSTYTVRKNILGTSNFTGTTPFTVVKSAVDVVSTDGSNISLPVGNKVSLYGYGKDMSLFPGIYNVQFSLVTADSVGNGLTASINSSSGEITLANSTLWTGTIATFKFRATYTGGTSDVVYTIYKPTNGTINATNGYNLLKYETQVYSADTSGAVTDLSEVAGPWATVTMPTGNDCTNLELVLHFPEGLRKIITSGEAAGNTKPASFIGEFQYKKDTDPTWTATTYITNGLTFTGTDFNGPREFGEGTSLPSYMYKFIRIYLTNKQGVGYIEGSPSYSNTVYSPAGFANERVQGSAWSTTATGVLKPTIPTDAVLLYEICLRSTVMSVGFDEVSRVSNLANIGAYSGMELTGGVTGYDPNGFSQGTYTYTVSTGYLLPNNSVVTDPTTGFNVKGSNLIVVTDNKKDAFNRTIRLENLSAGRYQIRLRRLNSSNPDIDSGYRQYYKAIFYTVTGRTETSVINPPTIGTPAQPIKLARTAFKFESSAKINGQIDGINGVVQTIARNWNGSNWNGYSPTSNPAALFLYVLTHPANAYRISAAEEATRIKLTGEGSLAEWSQYCTSMGFTYNNVMDGSRSVLEVLRDIAAAGRASPILIDGKWTVIIDKPRTTIVQHFSPHNSWGFEATKALPKLPHAFRIVYRNETNGFQETEQIVYNNGYTAANAEIFEELSLPGITNSTLVINHARWNLAQINLRPERYTLNTDIEYLVCNRGDRVKVVHDVPMWGSGSGRIKNYINSTTLELDEEMYLVAGTAYSIRIRTETGASIVRNTIVTAVTGYTNQLTLATTITATEAAPGNLFLFGTLNSESHDLIILNIEPLDNKNARVTLVDYSPEIYSIDLASNYPIPTFNPSITNYTAININPITEIPVFGTTRSDMGSVDLITGVSNLDINILNPINLPELINRIELYYYYSGSTSTTGSYIIVDINEGSNSIRIPNVIKNSMYTFKARYLDNTGRIGPWTSEVTHTIVGKTQALDTVASMTITRVHKNLIITPVIINRSNDFSNYEFRVIKGNNITDFWDTATDYYKVTSIDSAVVDLTNFAVPRISTNGTVYSVVCRAIDYQGNSSASSCIGQITLFELQT